jgi:uncharacterized protein (TIGR02646 family)
MRAIPPELWIPPVLRSRGLAARHLAKLKAKFAASEPLSFDHQEHWRRPEVQGVLLARQGSVCAYCGRNLLKPTTDDVEHFRPKLAVTEDLTHGGYWWLAYSVSNLFLSCIPCNRAYKRNLFPVDPPKGRVHFSRRVRLPREPRLLLDPICDPVEDLLRCAWEPELPYLTPAPGLSAWDRRRAEETIQLLHLNQREDLRQGWMRARFQLVAALDRGEEAEARRLASRVTPFSVVCRDMLKDLRPSLLPAPGDEILYLLDVLRDALRIAKGMAASPARTDETLRLWERCLWALAGVHRSTWQEQGAWVEQQLTDLNVLSELRPLSAQLTQDRSSHRCS